jgi:hypothetical protein
MFLDDEQKSSGKGLQNADPLAKEDVNEGKLFFVKMLSPNPCCGVKLTIYSKFIKTSSHLFKLTESEFTRSVAYVANFGTPTTMGVYGEEYAKELLAMAKRHVSNFYCNPGLVFYVEQAP